jgi:hypothetical protein
MMSVPKSDTSVISKQVIVWGRDDLLSWSVMSFLSARKDWEVISLLKGQSIDDLIQETETVHPDAIIVYQWDSAGNANLLAQLLSIYPDITVITVNPDDNSMDVYNKKQTCIQKVSDLISAIEAIPHSRRE